MEKHTPFEEEIRQTYHLEAMDSAFSNKLDSELRKRELSLTARRPKLTWQWSYA